MAVGFANMLAVLQVIATVLLLAKKLPVLVS